MNKKWRKLKQYRKPHICGIQGLRVKKHVHLEISYFARSIHLIEAVTLGLCHLEDFIFLENDVV